MTQRILVTGATGFLGMEIVRQLVDAGHTVRATGRNPRPPHEACEYVPCSLEQEAGLRQLVTDVDCVIHCAGLAHQFGPTPAAEFQRVNVECSEQLARQAAARGVRRLVFAGSISVYGPQSGLLTEETPCQPAADYGRSKLAAEHALQSVADASQLQLVTLRMSTVYGAEDRGNLLRLIRAIDRGRFVFVGSGGNRKTFIHRQDAAAACIAAATDSACGVFNVSGAQVTTREIVSHICRNLGRPLPRWHVPAPLIRGTLASLSPLASQRLAAVRRTINTWLSDVAVDGSRFKREFAASPQVPFERGIAEQVAWYLAEHGPPRHQSAA